MLFSDKEKALNKLLTCTALALTPAPEVEPPNLFENKLFDILNPDFKSREVAFKENLSAIAKQAVLPAVTVFAFPKFIEL